MLDIRRIRTEPDVIKANLAKRGEGTGKIDALLALDETRREKQTEWEVLRAEQNKLGPQIAAAKKAGEDATAVLAHLGELKSRLQSLDQTLKSLDPEQEALLSTLPNLVLDDVPEGGEECNAEIRGANKPLPEFDFEPRAHWDLGASLGLFDTERGAKLSGSGFVLYTGVGARLQRALINLMLDLHTTVHGYTELGVPYLLTRESITASGHIVKFAPEMYHDAESDQFFVPTAEPALVNVHRGELLEPGVLPIKYVAHTPCWRREAGAAGKDTRGLQRVHQFDKVEIFQYTLPEESANAQAEMVRQACAVLDTLEIPHRLLLLAAGDTGFSMARTVDIEAWAPGVGKWLEVSSASDGTDFQARRASIRFRREAGAKPEFPHLLNASGTALARVYAALLENHQNVDGSVTVPVALRPYLSGREKLEAK
ncbi:serine--tRNA ligase [Armatimonas sp.]|uniref:serine--tRNA ligase n=1 Tax=Armatimonas sp. TaxID=1872638 RepID=UPI003753552D